MAKLLSIPSNHVQPVFSTGTEGKTENKTKIIDVKQISSISPMGVGQLGDSFYVTCGGIDILVFYCSTPGTKIRADKGMEMRQEMLDIWSGKKTLNSELTYFQFL